MMHRTLSDQNQSADPSCRRAADRQPVDNRTTARLAMGRPLHVDVVDFSREGCQFVSSEAIAVGSAIRVGLSGAGSALCEVVWNRGDRYGCAFTQALDDADVARAFTGSTIVHIQPPSLPLAVELPEPQDLAKYAPRTRALIFVGAAAIGWAAVIAAILAVG